MANDNAAEHLPGIPLVMPKKLYGTWIEFTTPGGGHVELKLPADVTLADIELAQSIVEFVKGHMVADTAESR